jgi:hypothetical protein
MPYVLQRENPGEQGLQGSVLCAFDVLFSLHLQHLRLRRHSAAAGCLPVPLRGSRTLLCRVVGCDTWLSVLLVLSAGSKQNMLRAHKQLAAKTVLLGYQMGKVL